MTSGGGRSYLQTFQPQPSCHFVILSHQQIWKPALPLLTLNSMAQEAPYFVPLSLSYLWNSLFTHFYVIFREQQVLI